ncbi:flagellar biosynthetic protein FliR [Acutalibacter caecimuris]|uniref:flagellar biosynthetic protein FliR n=1 Tax=Acutalibacter caecimuris TaxID=3093657 RepID=UPI002AC953CD|nr:flagellar biosynthetic protein FliR [Acutalibacter sp. M00118]
MDAFDWNGLTLFMYIFMRMAGFVLFNPFFGRNNIPAYFKSGMTLVLAMSVSYTYTGTVTAPATFIELAVRLMLEVAIGWFIGVIINLFLFVPAYAGHIMDEQMGMAMAQTYDPSFQGQATPAANVLNIFAILIFFTANGHQTLLRLMLDSGGLVPFGSAALGNAAAEKVAQLFIECTLLAIKLCLPVLGAELMGQVGMGVLMKAIPQINVFAINIELKVLVGIILLYFLISPFSEFLMEMENTMLLEVEQAIALAGGG